MERLPSFEELEEQTKRETREKEREVLALVEDLLNYYISSFKELGTAKVTHYGREQVWSALTLQALKSLRWAYELLQKGYYSQANTLIRVAYEDWLVCMDCGCRTETVEAVLHGGRRVPNFKAMSDRLPNSLKNEWKDVQGEEGLYGFLSTFAHPRKRLVIETIDFDTGGFRVTPYFRENYFLNSSYYLLQCLVRMMEFLCRLVHPIKPDWTSETQRVMDKANVTLHQIVVQSARLVGNTTITDENHNILASESEECHDHPDP